MNPRMYVPVLPAAAALALALVVAGAPGAASAAPAADPVSQPYLHQVRGKDWNTAGTYIATGGTVRLELTRVPQKTRAFLEACGGSDLGRSRSFPAKERSTRLMAEDVEPGTCFVLLFRAATAERPYVIRGRLTY